MKSNVISLFDKQNIQSKKVRLDSQNEDVDPQNLERVKIRLMNQFERK